MRRSTARIAAVALAFGFASVAVPAASAQLPETFDLDTNSTSAPFGAPSSNQTPLTAGGGYVVQAQGTMSLWTLAQWSDPSYVTCAGTAEQAPVLASPGKTNGPVGVDAESRYAPLANSAADCASSLRPTPNVQLSGPGGFSHPAPLATSNAAAHVYRYPVRGSGAPLTARFVDPAPQDNYGVFRFTVGTPTVADCANGGAAALGFPSEAACVGSASANSVSATPIASPTDSPVTSAAASTSPLPVPAQLDTGAGAVAGVTASRICSSRRSFVIRIVERKKRPLKSARVTYLGRTVKAKRRKSDKRLVATINLRKRPVNRFSVSIRVQYKDGKRAKGVRKYFTCSSKRPSKPPKL